MQQKTLLYGALGATAIAAGVGLWRHRAATPTPTATTEVTLVDSPTKPIAASEIPIRLTSSDGTGLKLVALRAEAAIEDPLALTELHLEFENPENRVLEGTFRITLPQGASLSRFAMKVGGAWQEGEVVEKQAARRAYEDFLHRKQDPALLEQGAGNEFSARVFPIPARGRKEIIVTYAEVLEGGAPYVMPLRGLPQLGSLDVDVHAAGAKAAEAGGGPSTSFGIHQQQFTPNGDFVVEGKKLPRSPGLRNGNLAIARIVPFATSRPDPITSAAILVDTSASRGLGLGEQVKAVTAILAKLPPDAMVSIACFDQDVAPIYDGKASGFGEREAHAITARGALGASNFERAIDWAAKKAKVDRLVLVSDGVATAGETDAQKLRTKIEALRPAGFTRIDAVAIGGIRDDGFLRTIVRGVLDKDGVVLDAKLGPETLARRLSESTTSGVPVKVDGARWSWPDRLDGLQAGDEVLVYAEIPDGGAVKIDVGGQTFAPDLRTIDRPLVERAWAQAKIQSLVESPTEGAAATKQRIVDLSTRHRVLSPHTALLVLETDADYRRFAIDRNAKLDILAVQNGRVAVTQSPRNWQDRTATKNEEPSTGARARGDEGSMGRGRAGSAPAAAAPATPPRDVEPDTAANRASAAAEPAARAPSTTPTLGGDADGDAFGAGGLGLSGIGEGGGGRGEGIGLGNIGTIGHGAAASAAPPPAAEAAPMEAPLGGGAGTGSGQGFGAGHGRLGGSHAARPVQGGPNGALRQDSSGEEQRRQGPIGVVRPTTLEIDHGIAHDEAQRVMRSAVPRVRACYTRALDADPTASGRLAVRVTIDASGAVKVVDIVDAPNQPSLRACVQAAVKLLQFTAPGSSDAVFTQRFELVNSGAAVAHDTDGEDPNIAKALPYEGRFKTVMEALAHGNKDDAEGEANRWHTEQPGDILSLVALGEVYEARGDAKSAARAYGSILELFSFRADSRRFAGERLERLKDEGALALAIDTYGKAAEQRPDHPASHRLYAFTLLKHGEHEKAFAAMKVGASRTYPSGRFAGVTRILKEDLGLIAAAWAKAEPQRAAEIKGKLREAGGTEESGPSLRFVLNWETDANDVDFHIHDGKGGHAYYSQKTLPSGGELYADVTTGYGPECFTIRKPRAERAYPYTLQAHYYSRGPMGYGMGKLEIVEHDGSGGITFEERPFVVMKDHAYVDMGKVEKSAAAVSLK